MGNDTCQVCGAAMGPDRLHILIDNGIAMRHTYCCRRHRYTLVKVGSHEIVQERSNREIESLKRALAAGELAPGWE